MGWVLLFPGHQQCLQLVPGVSQFGRAQTARIRSTHQSVSRIHAELIVSPAQGPLSEVKPLEIRILDKSSTGHTFIDGTPAGKGEAKALKDGDHLSFGVDPVTFDLRWRPVVVSYSSRLPPAELTELEALARKGGFFLNSDWTPECTHLLVEQLSITPKLLCCMIDGGRPVSSSFTSALAKSGSSGEAEPLPDSSAHLPKAPTGTDTAHTTDLMAYAMAPRSRHGLFDGVWIVFTQQQAKESLDYSLSRAGSNMRFSAFSDSQAVSVVQELRRLVATSGTPREVWIVPSVTSSIASILAAHLREFACRCMVVTTTNIVSGILAGTREAVHASATIFAGLGLQPDGSFPETQSQHHKQPQQQHHQQQQQQLAQQRQQPHAMQEPFHAGGKKPEPIARTRNLPWNAQSTVMPAVQVKQQTVKEESFPSTQPQWPQQPQQQPLQQMQGLSAQPLRAQQPHEQQAQGCKRPASQMSGPSEQVRNAQKQNHDQQGMPRIKIKEEPQQDEQARTCPPPQPEQSHHLQREQSREIDNPGSLLSAPHREQSHHDARHYAPPSLKPKLENEQLQHQPPELQQNHQVVTPSITTMPQHKLEQPVPPKPMQQTPQLQQSCQAVIHSIPSLSQPKLEHPLEPKPRQLPSQSQQNVIHSIASLSQPKLEKLNVPGDQKLPASKIKNEEVDRKDLPQVREELPAKPAVLHPTGVWLPSLCEAKDGGNAIAMVEGVELPRAVWRCSVEPSPGKPVQGDQNFKRFRKSAGQLSVQREVVVCTPWVPPAMPGFAEAFGTQPNLDAESQIPELNI